MSVSGRAALASVLLLCSFARVAVAQGDGVQWFGALREMMHEGKTASVVQTTDVVPGPHTYAVGAVSELRGEITVLNDTVWLSYPDGDSYSTVVSASAAEGAALLVVARVEHWQEIVIEHDLTLSELRDSLPKLSAARGVSDDEPFVFRIDAVFPRLQLHIVDGEKLKPGTSPREHHAASVQIASPWVAATLVGFHSTKHHGVFTHHGESTHIHAVLTDPLVTGHVDDVLIPRGAILKIPRR